MTVQRTIACTLALLAAGCAGGVVHDLPAGHDLASDPQNGVVIGSIGALPAPLSPPWFEWSQYHYRSMSDPEVQGSITSAFQWNPYYLWGSMPRCDDDGLAAECGRLFALLLPAGSYEFSGVRPAMMDAATSSNAGASSRLQPLSGYRFEVRAGEAVYIGNLLSRICITGTGPRGGNAPWSAVGNVADRADRDVPLLIERYPNLQKSVITKRPMPGESWLWRYPELDASRWPAGCSQDEGERARYLRGDAIESAANPARRE